MQKVDRSYLWPGVPLALGSAILFGASTPFSKLLLGATSPQLLAGLLYLGAGIGLAVVHLGRPAVGLPTTEAPLRQSDIPWLAAVVLFGGVIGPLLLMLGLVRTDAASAALLLNLEGLATMGIAWLAFRENVDGRLLLGASAILAGAVVLSWEGQGGSLDSGALLIMGACLAWGIDNNLTRKLSSADPVLIAMTKGLVAGTMNVGLGLLRGAALPSILVSAEAALAGFLGIGVSLVLFVLALRHLGAARTGAYFSLAPFIGALLAVTLLHDPLSVKLAISGGLMGFGLWMHLAERHDHPHEHQLLEHEHSHIHDEHHQHTHEGPFKEPHSHWHRHEPMRHSHPHYPDLHHRHGHAHALALPPFAVITDALRWRSPRTEPQTVTGRIPPINWSWNGVAQFVSAAALTSFFVAILVAYAPKFFVLQQAETTRIDKAETAPTQQAARTPPISLAPTREADERSETPKGVSEGHRRGSKMTPAPPGKFFRKRLPNGVALSIPEISMEAELLEFLDDKSALGEKITWFNFDRLVFGVGGRTPQPASLRQLRNVAKILRAYPHARGIIGVQIYEVGDTDVNIRLSKAQAESVLRELKRRGVDASSLEVRSFDRDHLGAIAGIDERRATNRRISLGVIHK